MDENKTEVVVSGTKGPWMVGGDWNLVINTKGLVVAQVTAPELADRSADAQLIAQAPALLKEVHELRQELALVKAAHAAETKEAVKRVSERRRETLRASVVELVRGFAGPRDPMSSTEQERLLDQVADAIETMV